MAEPNRSNCEGRPEILEFWIRRDEGSCCCSVEILAERTPDLGLPKNIRGRMAWIANAPERSRLATVCHGGVLLELTTSVRNAMLVDHATPNEFSMLSPDDVWEG